MSAGSFNHRGPLTADGYNFSEFRFTTDTVTSAALNGTTQARPAGLFVASVVGSLTVTAGSGTIRLILEGTNDGTTWFVISQSTVAQAFSLTGEVRSLNEDDQSLVNVQRFRSLRVRATVLTTTAAPFTWSLSVEWSGMMLAGSSILQTSPSLAFAGASPTNDAVFGRQAGAIFASLQATVAAGFVQNGATVFANLQGSLDGGTVWVTIAQSIAITAAGSQQVFQDGFPLINLGGFNFLRFQISFVGGPPTGSVIFNLCYDSADARAGIYAVSADAGELPSTTFAIVQADAPTAEAANTRTVTVRLEQADGSPLAAIRRMRAILYVGAGAGLSGLSPNATFSAIALGTAQSAFGTNTLSFSTDATGVATLSILDAAVETVQLSVLDEGPKTGNPFLIVQTIEVALGYV